MFMAITSGALLGAAGVGAASNLISGILGIGSQKSANAQNLQIARETNAQNKELFNRSLAWQEDMWNKTNKYNAPDNQVKLLQQAGINPAAVYGNGQTSPASMPSVPSAPQMQGATMQPIDYSAFANVVDQGVNAFLNNNILSNQVTKSSADAQIAKVEAEFRAKTLQDSCIRIMNDAKKSEFEKEQARMIMQVLEGTKNEQILQSKWQTKIQEQQYNQAVENIAIAKLQQEAMRIANEFAPAFNQATLRQYKANIEQLYSAVRANDASAAHSAAMAALTDLQSSGVKIDNQVKESTANSLVDKAKYESLLTRENVYSAEDRRFMYAVDEYQKHMGKAANYTITPGSASAVGELMDRNNKRDRLGSQHKERFRPRNNR